MNEIVPDEDYEIARAATNKAIYELAKSLDNVRGLNVAASSRIAAEAVSVAALGFVEWARRPNRPVQDSISE